MYSEENVIFKSETLDFYKYFHLNVLLPSIYLVEYHFCDVSHTNKSKYQDFPYKKISKKENQRSY